MKIEINNPELKLDVRGYSGTAINKNYIATGFSLMDKTWQTIRLNNLKHKGLNIWIYEPDEKVFAGVELEDNSKDDTGLEKKSIALVNYARYKHIGPYDKIKKAGENMKNELKSRGFEIEFPYIEIYGHWNNDETKLETELIMALKK